MSLSRAGTSVVSPVVSQLPHGSLLPFVTRFSLLCSFASSSFARQSPLCSSALPSSLSPPLTMVQNFHIFLRPAVATSIISLLSVINPVSVHVTIPFRPRAHAAAIQLRSFNAADGDFERRANVPLEVRQLNGRGLGDVLGGVGDTVDTLLGGVLGGGSTTTSNPPANSTPAPAPAPSATTGTQGTGGGNTGKPRQIRASTVTHCSRSPTTFNK